MRQTGDASGASLLCIRCGYCLRGLVPSGVCPECALPIADSLAHRRLGLSSPSYLATLRTGAMLAIVAMAGLVISGFLRWPAPARFVAFGTQPAFVWLDVAAGALLIGGTWMLTIDDPGLHPKDQARPNKRAMRGAAIGLLVLAVASALASVNLLPALPRAGGSPATVSIFAMILPVIRALVELAAWLTLATGLVNYSRWLAVRVPDPKLLGAAHTMAWLLPCAFIIAFAASPIFGSAMRLLPLSLMTMLIGTARGRMRSEQSRAHEARLPAGRNRTPSKQS